ncbi:hypothetical protein [Planktotalea sp.]|uniref:CBU_0592 family membrane protein n=1 Tax=Planktotalea sp. TaxID=2029877 RepID=UPI00329A247A
MLDTFQYFADLTPYQFTGLIGFVCYVASFGSLQLGWLDGNSMTYSICNVLAASLVAVSLMEAFNLASALIQGSWIIFGLLGLALRAKRAFPSARPAQAAAYKTEVL